MINEEEENYYFLIDLFIYQVIETAKVIFVKPFYGNNACLSPAPC